MDYKRGYIRGFKSAHITSQNRTYTTPLGKTLIFLPQRTQRILKEKLLNHRLHRFSQIKNLSLVGEDKGEGED